MPGLLHDKITLVTGASSGIGRAAALVFAREGAKVVVADMVEEGGHETVKLIKSAGGEAVFARCDVARAADAEALVATAVKHFGRLDCAYNNAGISGKIARTADETEDGFDRIMAINLRGVWLCMKYEILQMLKQEQGWGDRQYRVGGRAGGVARDGRVRGFEAWRCRSDQNRGARIRAS
jgi:NAD(P)-dependent dehydrogenase (short-subunit alcohol dehydrogenase family)